MRNQKWSVTNEWMNICYIPRNKKFLWGVAASLHWVSLVAHVSRTWSDGFRYGPRQFEIVCADEARVVAVGSVGTHEKFHEAERFVTSGPGLINEAAAARGQSRASSKCVSLKSWLKAQTKIEYGESWCTVRHAKRLWNPISTFQNCCLRSKTIR